MEMTIHGLVDVTLCQTCDTCCVTHISDTSHHCDAVTFFMTQCVSTKAGFVWIAYIQQKCGTEKPYGSAQHLIEDALDNGLARPFVQHLLEVRCNEGSRKKWVLLQQCSNHGVQMTGPTTELGPSRVVCGPCTPHTGDRHCRRV